MSAPDTWRLKQAEDDIKSLKEKLEISGGGGDNGGMTLWQTSVENRLGQLHTDIVGLKNFLLIAYGAGFLAMLGIFGAGFASLDHKFERVNERMDITNATLSDIQSVLSQQDKK